MQSLAKWLVLIVAMLTFTAGCGADSATDDNGAGSNSDGSAMDAETSKAVNAAAAQVTWDSRTLSDQVQICYGYNMDREAALIAIDSGIGGGQPGLLEAFDQLLSPRVLRPTR